MRAREPAQAGPHASAAGRSQLEADTRRLPRSVPLAPHPRSAMRITERWPSPASYSPLPDSAVLSTKRNHSPVSFGREKRFSPSSDKADALQPRRPLIPGPKYLPMYDGVRPQTRSATIGTAKRFSYR